MRLPQQAEFVGFGTRPFVNTAKWFTGAKGAEAITYEVTGGAGNYVRGTSGAPGLLKADGSVLLAKTLDLPQTLNPKSCELWGLPFQELRIVANVFDVSDRELFGFLAQTSQSSSIKYKRYLFSCPYVHAGVRGSPVLGSARRNTNRRISVSGPSCETCDPSGRSSCTLVYDWSG